MTGTLNNCLEGREKRTTLTDKTITGGKTTENVGPGYCEFLLLKISVDLLFDDIYLEVPNGQTK